MRIINNRLKISIDSKNYDIFVQGDKLIAKNIFTAEQLILNDNTDNDASNLFHRIHDCFLYKSNVCYI